MKKNEGFTLIELIVVVTIVAILSALAIPAFLKFAAKARRSEVKINLEAIHKAELTWYGEAKGFDNSFTSIGWRPAGTVKYFTFSLGNGTEGVPASGNPMPSVAVPFANDNAFAAYGWGNIDTDMTIDVWHIDERKNLDNDTDDLDS
ncbi:MAG TPA: prepilin-type N-terminal cleavage/methylation domain-containing protein [Candidatus Methylomirabilis sp.]|nr:prepilin-type N-terminal cleavage/methylation domain-containing protein [Candidatus Methylomirabilis sp.]